MLQQQSQDKLQNLLIQQEGYRQFAYKDTVGKLTIAIGRNIEEKGISKQEAMVMLGNDISYFDAQLNSKLPFYSSLDEVRKCVLVDMAFNLGMNRLLGFKRTLDLVSLKQYAAAAREMLDSTWSHQVGKRSVVLSIMMETGHWPSEV